MAPARVGGLPGADCRECPTLRETGRPHGVPERRNSGFTPKIPPVNKESELEGIRIAGAGHMRKRTPTGREPSGHRPEVRVMALCSLNGRERRILIDPTVDLANQPRDMGHATWIIPLGE